MAAEAAGADARTAGAEADDFLRELLAERPVPQKDVKDASDGAGLSWATVRRAKTRLGVTVQRESVGASGAGRWTWALPARCSSTPQGTHVSDVSTLHKVEHLAAEPETSNRDGAPSCAHCGGTEGNLVFASVAGEDVHLHTECEADYLRGGP